MRKLAGLLCISLVMMSCNVEQKKEAELPEIDVDVDAEAGQLPTFDVDWADVNVGTRTETVKIPKVVVVMEEEEIEIPYIDVDMPNDGDKEELNIMVEAEVEGKEHEIHIKEVVATNNTLYVISMLEEKDQDLGDQKLRVSDQLIINAPDLNVKHIIVGERPDRVFNKQYKYVTDINAFKRTLNQPKVIYTK